MAESKAWAWRIATGWSSIVVSNAMVQSFDQTSMIVFGVWLGVYSLRPQLPSAGQMRNWSIFAGIGALYAVSVTASSCDYRLGSVMDAHAIMSAIVGLGPDRHRP
jgi:hypothetical protein